jgi:hypothetical protein
MGSALASRTVESLGRGNVKGDEMRKWFSGEDESGVDDYV